MPPLNYRHLYYFWAAAREGGVTAAAEKLHVSQSSMSTQIKKLERALGHELFDRSGRSMSLTAEGRVVLEYADDIFRLGRELRGTVQRSLAGRPLELRVGLADSIPKLVAIHLLEPAFGLPDPVRLHVREDRTDRLLSELATHDLDLVLSDMPIPANVSVQAFNHLLGESTVEIFASPSLAPRLRDGFPESLSGAPFILPAEGYTLRRSLDEWFGALDVVPMIVAEVQDSALIKAFGEDGIGAFAAPSIVGDEIVERYSVHRVGCAMGVTERFYAITAERRLKHPAVVAISEDSKRQLFVSSDPEPDSGQGR
jgi:LysR family transcriptional activator of nhaA